MRKLGLYISIIALVLPLICEAQINSTLRRDELTLPADYGDSANTAFSLRHVSDSYSGPVIRATRAKDSVEADFWPENIVNDSIVKWAGQNLARYSNKLDSSWIYSGVTANYNFDSGPVGFDSATLFVVQGVNMDGPYQTIGLEESFNSGDVITVSFWVKSMNTIQGNYRVELQSFNGTSYSTAGSMLYSITESWQRRELSFVLAQDDISILRPRLMRATSSNSFAGDSILIWGVQVEKNHIASSYKLTRNEKCCSALVNTWYNQMQTRHAYQGDFDRQPQIVKNGFLVRDNGKAAIEFDGLNDYLNADSIGTHEDHSYFLVYRRTKGYIYSASYTLAHSTLIFGDIKYWCSSSSDRIVIHRNSIQAPQTLFTAYRLESEMHGRVNSNHQASILTTKTFEPNHYSHQIGWAIPRNNESEYYEGYHQEIIYYSNSSFQKYLSQIEGSINKFYRIF